jgi:hypothetical protein
MEAGATLRILMTRKMSFEGPYYMDSARVGIVLPTFKAFDSKGKEVKKVKEGDVVKLVCDTSFSVAKRVVVLRPAQAFYDAGQIHGALMFDETHGSVQPVLTFYAEQDLDLTKVGSFGKLYVHERGSV